MNKIRYNHLNSYLKNKFGSRTLKICVDGGFSCPNRDGKVGLGGCIFCGEMGAGELIKGRKNCVLDSIENQVKTFLNSYRGERADKFIVYFQNFTNTYDTIINLKQKYDKALQVSDKIVGLQIATRPDTLSDEVIDLIASYKDKYYVCVELGLQTSNDSIGKMINRGYDTSQFEDAVSTLNSDLVRPNRLNAEVILIAIMDGVLYIKGKNKMYEYLSSNDDKVIISSLLLREYLYSL